MSICIMSTRLDGGTYRHYMEMARSYSFRCHVVLAEFLHNVIFVSHISNGIVEQEIIFTGKNMVSDFNDELRKLHVGLIHLHHFIYMNAELYAFFINKKYRLAITLHDYYTICPRINMTFNGIYCNEGNEKKCTECIDKHAGNNFEIFRTQIGTISNIKYWRKYFEEILHRADYVFVPSNDQRERLLRYFPSLGKIRVVENPEIITPIVKTSIKKIIRVGILGTISEAKGRTVLVECSKMAEKQKLPIEFVLFGRLEPNMNKLPKNLIIKGPYREEEIYDLIKEEIIDFFWFTAVWPETYSYVLTIPIRLKIPVIAADIGAISERIKRGNWGIVYPFNAGYDEILQSLMHFDYHFYHMNGDFSIKNKSFLSFGELYGNIQLQDEATSAKSKKRLFSTANLEIYGVADNLYPNEMRILWHKKRGIFWKYHLVKALDKSMILKKIFEKFRLNIIKRKCHI